MALDQHAAARRAPLSRDQVLRAAVTLADESGIEALSMRKLGRTGARQFASEPTRHAQRWAAIAGRSA